MPSHNLQDKALIEKIYTEILSSYEDDANIHKYLTSMNENEKHALVVSKIILESSFSVEKSIGYLESPYSKKIES